MLEQRARGGKCIGAAGADGAETVVGFDDIAVAGKEKGGFGVGDDQQGFEMPESAVLAPVLGQLDGGFLQIAGKLLKLAFEAFEKREGVGGGAGKARDDFVVVEAARLASGVLH